MHYELWSTSAETWRGLPAYNVWAGTSFVTTLPAPTMAPLADRGPATAGWELPADGGRPALNQGGHHGPIRFGLGNCRPGWWNAGICH